MTFVPADLFDHRLELSTPSEFIPSALPTNGGVYCIADGDDRPILFSACEDLRRVVTARMAAPPPDRRTKRVNLAEIARRICWSDTFSPFETAWRYHAMARTLYPTGYRKLLGFGPVWFLRGDAREPIPRITTVCETADDAARYVGPFARRRDADAIVHELEDLFDLCRKYDILRQAPRGQPCEYLEMGRCPAPCDGRFAMSAYQQRIDQALDFAAGRTSHLLDELKQRMNAAATGREYERAQVLREMIAKASVANDRPERRFVGELDAFRFLIVQRGGPRSRSAQRMLVRPFFASAAGIRAGEPVRLSDLDPAVETWRRDSRESMAPRGDAIFCSELMWLVGHFVFQGERAAGLFVRADRIGPADAIAAEIRRRFTTPRANQAADIQPLADMPREDGRAASAMRSADGEAN